MAVVRFTPWVFVLAWLAPLDSVSAASFNMDVGVIYSAEVGNPFGVSVGDRVTLSGEYDDSFYDGVGLARVPFSAGTGNVVSITIGTVTFNETDDDFYSSGIFPRAIFDDGSIL